jgi:hypothetical protein
MPRLAPRPSFLLYLALVVALTAPVRADPTIQIGDPFPDFSALDHNDAVFQLSSHQGKVVVLHVCALWCEACIASANFEEDLIEELAGDIGADNFLMVDVLLEDQNFNVTGQPHATAWRSVTDTPALTIHGSGSGELRQLFRTTLAVNATPTYFILSPDGTVADIQISFLTNDPIADAVRDAWAPFALDVEPPRIAGKRDVIVESKLAPVLVKYSTPTAVDEIDGPVSVTCNPRSGTGFRFGVTTVGCSASDGSGNSASSAFDVIVRLPTTPGAVTTPGGHVLTHIAPGQAVRVTAGGFAPASEVLLSFFDASGLLIPLVATTTALDGTFDIRANVPKSVPSGSSQIIAIGQDLDGAEFVRAWILGVRS